MLNINELNKMVDEKYVNVQKHKDVDYFIYNYGPKTQFERVWNDITLQCRGLILDANYNIIARPFKKFFNLEELEELQIPTSNFEVYEKMDGSLGILYWIGEEPYIATRGSFESIQSDRANRILREKYSHTFSKLDKSKTYLFEIIYPENRIVVSYGELEDLILLAVIDNSTGLDCKLEDIGFPIVTRYNGVNDIAELKKLEVDNKEGFVVKFQNGFRLKVKFEEYCRLHKILTNVSNRTVWEYLSEGKDFNELLDRVPDEFYNWVRSAKQSLLNKYHLIEDECYSRFSTLKSVIDLSDRKKFAMYAKEYKYSSILFLMLDNKNYSKHIWRMIYPDYEKPFANNGE